jgi:hypothetical protein
LGNRFLNGNQLTALAVGVFDKNTALTSLYVDTKQKGLGDGAQKGEQLRNGGMRQGRASAREKWQRSSLVTFLRLSEVIGSLKSLGKLVRRCILTPTSFLPYLGNRWLENNQLTSLPLSVFDENTKLISL